MTPPIQTPTIEPDIVVVELSGRIVLGRESQQVEEALDELIAGKQKKVVLDLSKLEYVDSTAIGILVTRCGQMEAAGGDMRIASMQPKVEDLMRTAKLHRILHFYPTVADALQGFATTASQS
jgi:anti-sigma B factor antagonist